MRLLVISPALSVVAFLVCSCGGGNAASQLARAPDYQPKDQTKCSVEKSQAKPLIVEWPSADRGELEAQAHNHGLVVVRYQGCEMKVLDGCTVQVKYGYSPITRKKDRVVMRDADDLYANIPMGAARFEAKLEKSGELDVDMTMVGRWEADRRDVRPDELRGSCDGATHVIAALTVGAFTFFSGADAAVGGGATAMGAGGGAQSTSRRETLNADGDEGACEKSAPDDRSPPANCGAMLRVEVVPLGTAAAAAAAAAVTQTDCPDGTRWDGSHCVATVSTQCAAGLHFETGKGCVPNVGALGPRCPPLDPAACEAACRQHDAPSCTQLGTLYSGGFAGLPNDPVRGFTFLEMGCDGGDMLGCHDIGQALVQGIGAAKDPARAVRVFTRVCDAGWADGCTWAAMSSSDPAQKKHFQDLAASAKSGLPWTPKVR